MILSDFTPRFHIILPLSVRLDLVDSIQGHIHLPLESCVVQALKSIPGYCDDDQKAEPVTAQVAVWETTV